MSHLRKLLADSYVAHGVDRERADELAGQAVHVLLAVDVLQAARLEAWERDAQIYHLRGQRVTVVALEERFSVSRAWVYGAVRRHAQRRRAALRIA